MIMTQRRYIEQNHADKNLINRARVQCCYKHMYKHAGLSPPICQKHKGRILAVLRFQMETANILPLGKRLILSVPSPLLGGPMGKLN